MLYKPCIHVLSLFELNHWLGVSMSAATKHNVLGHFIVSLKVHHDWQMYTSTFHQLGFGRKQNELDWTTEDNKDRNRRQCLLLLDFLLMKEMIQSVCSDLMFGMKSKNQN